MTPSKYSRSQKTSQPEPYGAGLDLTFDAIDLIHKVGSHRAIERTVTSTEQVGDPVFGVRPGTPITLNATLESVSEGVFVTGQVTSELDGECSRCLDPVHETIEVGIDELFSYPDKVPADLEDEDVPVLTGDEIDLGPLVHDALAVAAPFQPLCREDCAGLCAECGARLENDPGHHHEVIDPRFAALQGMFAGADPADAAGDGEGRA